MNPNLLYFGTWTHCYVRQFCLLHCVGSLFLSTHYSALPCFNKAGLLAWVRTCGPLSNHYNLKCGLCHTLQAHPQHLSLLAACHRVCRCHPYSIVHCCSGNITPTLICCFVGYVAATLPYARVHSQQP